VLARLNGQAISGIAREHGVSRPTVTKWVRRYDQDGVAGLLSRKSPGRPQSIHPAVRAEIVRLPQETRPPHDLGDRWTTRTLADVFGISPASVSAIWRKAGHEPELHLQQVLSEQANADRMVCVRMDLRVPAWLRLHWELCRRAKNATETISALSALTRPDEWATLRSQVLPGLEKRWHDQTEALPRVNPRSLNYRSKLRETWERGHAS